MGSVILIFLDGVGIGAKDSTNPFFLATPDYLPFFEGGGTIPGGTEIIPIDCSCAIPGTPQSATTQTALFTGAFGPELLGDSHRGGYPDKTLRRVISEKNLLSELQKSGLKARFFNAYPYHSRWFHPPHLKIVRDGRLEFSEEFPRQWRRMISVTTCLLLTINQYPYDETDLLKQQALYQDYSNQTLIDRGAALPLISPEKAGSIIFNGSRTADFLLYEYFQTDIYAHRRSLEECLDLIRNLDLLLKALISRLNPSEDTLILTSDHGNLEDLSRRDHSLNPVPLLVWGKGGEKLRSAISKTEEITPAILNWMT